MTEQQQVLLDAILREGGLDLGTDAQTLRAAFEETMKRVPVADDVEQSPTRSAASTPSRSRSATLI